MRANGASRSAKTDGEGSKEPDMTHSLGLREMPALCAKETAGGNVKWTLWIVTVDASIGR